MKSQKYIDLFTISRRMQCNSLSVGSNVLFAVLYSQQVRCWLQDILSKTCMWLKITEQNTKKYLVHYLLKNT